MSCSVKFSDYTNSAMAAMKHQKELKFEHPTTTGIAVGYIIGPIKPDGLEATAGTAQEAGDSAWAQEVAGATRC